MWVCHICVCRHLYVFSDVIYMFNKCIYSTIWERCCSEMTQKVRHVCAGIYVCACHICVCRHLYVCPHDVLSDIIHMTHNKCMCRHLYFCVTDVCAGIFMYALMTYFLSHLAATALSNRTMGWLRLVASFKLYVSFAKEPYKRDDILQKRPIILRSLLLVATLYQIGYIFLTPSQRTFWFNLHDTYMMCVHFWHFPLNLLPPKSTKLRNSDFSVRRGANSEWDFGLIWICIDEFGFLNLVDFGDVAFSVESLISICISHDVLRVAVRREDAVAAGF